jgi:hypothetical protein
MARDATAPEVDELSQLRAPEEFRRAIVRDPYASIYRFDYDAVRGGPIDPATVYAGGTIVPLDGYYFDLDGAVVAFYRAGDVFPHLAPVRGAGGEFIFVTDRRDATASDLRYIILRRGWGGNVKDIIIR